MMRRKVRRWLAVLLALLLCFSVVSFSCVMAEESSSVEVPDKPEETGPDEEEIVRATQLPVVLPTDKPETTPRPEETDEPEKTPVPEVTDEPEETPIPEATDVPEATPDPESTEEPEETLNPEATTAPEGPEQSVLPEEIEPTLDPNVSAEPTPSPEPSPTPENVPGFEMRDRSTDRSDLRLNPANLQIPSDGMPIPLLYQYDYKKTVCSIEGESKSVASSGCGATAASMLIAYIRRNYDQTPYSLFYWAADNGWYHGDGLDYEGIRTLLTNHGVDTRLMGVSSDGIISALKNNRPIIIKMGPGTFTNEGHYIVLRGLDENGRVLVNDPGSSSRSQRSYPAGLISKECKSSHMLVAYTLPESAPKGKAPEPETAQEAAAAEPEVSVTETPVPEREDSVMEAQAAEDGGFDGDYLAVVNYKSVNLREAPVDGLIVTSVKEGTVLRVTNEVMEDDRLWCAVEYQGSTLYIRGDMLSTDNAAATAEEYLTQAAAAEPESKPEPEPAAEPELVEVSASELEPEPLSETEDGAFEGSYLATVNYKSVNLRDLPGTDNTKSMVVTSVKEGTTLCVVDEVTDEDGRVWCAVLYQKQKLYIRGDLLTVLN